MEIQVKLQVLKRLETKDLIEKLHQYEDELEKAMTAEADFKTRNHQFLASLTGDCQQVKTLEAELLVQAPEADEEGRKLTIPQKESWLRRQRTENKELSEAIVKQHEVSFLLEDHRIRVEMPKKRLEGIRAIIGLRTQQIAFLAS